MEPNFSHNRQQAHVLLDLLPEEKVDAVRNLLAVMVEPLAYSLSSVVVEDEGLTPEAVAAIERGRASLAQGEGVPHEDILREFEMNQ
jgi:hypothetical protein